MQVVLWSAIGNLSAMKTSILELDEMAPRRHSVLSLYSGAMGLDIGMHQTGRFRLLGCVEKVPAFCDTIRRNRDAGLLGRQPFEVFQADMSELDPGQLMADVGCIAAPPTSISVPARKATWRWFLRVATGVLFRKMSLVSRWARRSSPREAAPAGGDG